MAVARDGKPGTQGGCQGRCASSPARTAASVINSAVITDAAAQSDQFWELKPPVK
jgi:hypothetical protein